MPSNAALDAFASLLASTEDDAARERLIARAKMKAMKAAPESAFEPPIRTLGEYLASTIEVPPVLVEPFLVVRGGINATVGRAGKGKTVMNLNRALRWSAGKPLFDGWRDGDGNLQLAPSHPLRILIVENEGAAGLFHRQIGIMVNNDEFMTDEDRALAKENILIWGEGGYSNLKFDDPRKLDNVRQGVDKFKPDIVFVEPFRSLWKGEENSATEMNVVTDALVALATDFECAVQISHHERKGGMGEGSQEKMNAARGSSVLEGVVTVMENFESVSGGEFRELSWSKSRHGAAPNPVRMEWVPDSWWYRHVPQEAMDEAIISGLRGNADEPMNVTDLCSELDESNSRKVRDTLKRMEDDGKIKSMPSISGAGGSSGKRYRLPVTEESEYGGLSI
jgi:hypothetical protein